MLMLMMLVNNKQQVLQFHCCVTMVWGGESFVTNYSNMKRSDAERENLVVDIRTSVCWQ
jgi:hypothetical protein